MKILFLSLIASSAFAIENNAYVSIERLEDMQMHGCMIYDGHYFIINDLEHYSRCPCIDINCH